jgi:hypothetical protein
VFAGHCCKIAKSVVAALDPTIPAEYEESQLRYLERRNYLSGWMLFPFPANTHANIYEHLSPDVPRT